MLISLDIALDENTVNRYPNQEEDNDRKKITKDVILKTDYKTIKVQITI